jgi:hypothetical protein
LAVRLHTEAPRKRLHSLAFLSLVVLVEAAWAVALGVLVLHFV